MIKIYFPKPYSKAPRHPILYKTKGVDTEQLGIKIKAEQFTYDFESVIQPEDADLILIPHAFRTLDIDSQKYIKHQYEKLKELNKPFVVCVFGDNSHDCHLSFGILLKTSAYRNDVRVNEVVMPAYSEDWSETEGMKTLEKTSKPVVSFCGLADFGSVRGRLAYFLKNIRFYTRPERRPGIYYRRKLVKIFKRSYDFSTYFILRKRFSSSKATIEMPYEKAREEFYQSILNAHFVITPKGGGNYSNRFYEALSLGRTPIIPDSLIALPLENLISYNDYVIKVPMLNLDLAPQLAKYFYEGIKDIETLQHATSSFYKENLRFDKCLIKIFNLIIERDPRVFIKVKP